MKEYEAVVKTMLERIVDRMKTSAEDIPVLLVGGGVVLAPDTLVGASRVEKPEYAGVANAVGAGKFYQLSDRSTTKFCIAAIAKVSGTVDTVVVTSDKSTQETLAEVSNIAIERAVANGAKRETVIIAEMESLPLMVGFQYLPIWILFSLPIDSISLAKPASSSKPSANSISQGAQRSQIYLWLVKKNRRSSRRIRYEIRLLSPQ